MRWQIIFLILSVLSFEGYGQSFQSLLDSAVTSKERSILYFGEAQKKIQTADDSLNFLFAKTNRSYRDKRQDSTLYYGKRFLRHAGIDQVPEQCFLICRWISRTYIDLGVYEESLSFSQQGLEWAKKANDINGVAYQLADIAIIYHEFKDFDKGVAYGKICFNTAVEGGADSMHKAICLNAIAINFDDWNKPDSALFYHFKIFELDPVPDSIDIKFTFNNIGNTLMKMQQYVQAEQYLLTSLELARRINSPYTYAGSFTNLGQLKTKQKNFRQAGIYFDSALHYALASKSLEKIRDTYFDLYTFNKERGDLRQALAYQDKFYVLRDSIFKNERLKTVSELETKYQTSIKDNQILEQNAELVEREAQFNRAIIVAVFLIVLIGMLVIILLLNKSRFKRKQELLEKELEIQLQEASIQAALSSQELERKRFAQDLHDGMGQLISSLRLLLGNINSNSPMESRVEVVSKSERVIDEMQKEIRGIAFNLMPQTLIQFGLVPALKEMALRVTSSGQVMVSVTSFDVPDRLSELLEISLYRVIQEWVNNILKYGQAPKIEIQLVGHENELSITIEDTGKGFDTGVLELGSGNGWRNILSRIKLVHGELEIDSHPKRSGTTLIIRVPVEGVPQEQEAEKLKNTL
ncbi:MAG TPA: sensor histidine kinase [Cyclobacteriaceae bacterium]|nr:sensor histidine kinase [Cyclobacteriaceae bacterium]